MLDVALKLLKELTDNSYQAYIVGGFVRDYLLDVESSDIDITTNATPKQVKEIFEDSCLPNEDYGSVVVIKKGIRFDITTFRKEIGYINNRKPSEIKYIDNLYEDLLRRDFTINALCINDKGEVLDFLGGREDLNNRIIKTIGKAKESFEDDVLRVLRAIRFATILDFSLDEEIIQAIAETKHLLKKLSYQRKREELDKIFTSPNYKKGIKMLLDLGLDKELELNNLNKVLETDTVSLIGIWSILDVSSVYPFNKNELELIKTIHLLMNEDVLDPVILYKYGLYVASVVGEIKRIDNVLINEKYRNLPIKSRKDIDIESDDIIYIMKKAPGSYIKEIYSDIETEILYNRLINKKTNIVEYITKKYKEEIN